MVAFNPTFAVRPAVRGRSLLARFLDALLRALSGIHA
jgi:hypothetical protein